MELFAKNHSVEEDDYVETPIQNYPKPFRVEIEMTETGMIIFGGILIMAMRIIARAKK